MDRYGLTRSTGAEGRSPDDAAAEGFLGRMKTESVHPEHWEERTRSEALVPVDDCIRWHDHERIRRPDESGAIPSEPGNGRVTISKKNARSPPSRCLHIFSKRSGTIHTNFFSKPCRNQNTGTTEKH